MLYIATKHEVCVYIRLRDMNQDLYKIHFDQKHFTLDLGSKSRSVVSVNDNQDVLPQNKVGTRWVE